MISAAIAQEVIDALARRGATLAVAESLTGGALAAAIVDVPGASQVFRGGAVTYATDAKISVLGVDTARISQFGPVDAEVAKQMAYGVAQLFDADYALATTGVAGPGAADGHPAGTVWLGIYCRECGSSRAILENFDADRAGVRAATVQRALQLLLEDL
ncbi:MAG: CinA family protein [Trueperella sp.]|nr:CinA family protein [Trueperella sp.]